MDNGKVDNPAYPSKGQQDKFYNDQVLPTIGATEAAMKVATNVKGTKALKDMMDGKPGSKKF
jgi:hypothetical protein